MRYQNFKIKMHEAIILSVVLITCKKSNLSILGRITVCLPMGVSVNKNIKLGCREIFKMWSFTIYNEWAHLFVIAANLNNRLKIIIRYSAY